jgi:hypothetical protein
VWLGMRWLRNRHIKLVSTDHASMRGCSVPCLDVFWDPVELRSE